MDIPLFSFVRHSIDALCQAVKRRLHHWTKPDNHALVLNTVLVRHDQGRTRVPPLRPDTQQGGTGAGERTIAPAAHRAATANGSVPSRCG